MLKSELVALKRKDLQVLAEEHGLNANKESNQLIAELLIVLAFEAMASEATAEVSAEHNSLPCNENSQKVSC